MAQAVGRRLITSESRVRARVNPCGICGEQSDTGTGFLRVLLFSPVSIIPPSFAILIHIIWGTNNMSVSGSSSETESHPKEICNPRLEGSAWLSSNLHRASEM
jgi:hypothetical protein